jgi:hypothetical protein
MLVRGSDLRLGQINVLLTTVGPEWAYHVSRSREKNHSHAKTPARFVHPNFCSPEDPLTKVKGIVHTKRMEPVIKGFEAGN